MKVQLMLGRSVEYVDDFYARREADDILRSLRAVDMAPEVIRMFGRDTVTKRRAEHYGEDYNFNPAAGKSTDWTPLMTAIRECVERVAGRLDSGLVRLYPDGEADIGWHKDTDNPEVIASLSFGAERLFAFGVGPARKCKQISCFRLAHGSLLLIPAETNETFKHRLVPEQRIRDPRVNITLRRFRQSE